MAYIKNATEQAYNYIINKIKDGLWKSGDKIATQNELQEEIGVSLISIRNAVDKLVGKGILRKIQGSGTFVETVESIGMEYMPILDIPDENIMQVLDVREFLEPLTVELFIKNAYNDHILELEKSFIRIKDFVGDDKKFYKEDFNFHRLLAQGCGNIFIIKINESMVDILENHHKSLYLSINHETVVENHREILKYIKMRNKNMASLAMKLHISEVINSRKLVMKEIIKEELSKISVKNLLKNKIIIKLKNIDSLEILELIENLKELGIKSFELSLQKDSDEEYRNTIKCMALIKKYCKDMIWGVGNVLNTSDIELAMNNKAMFLSIPTASERLVAEVKTFGALCISLTNSIGDIKRLKNSGNDIIQFGATDLLNFQYASMVIYSLNHQEDFTPYIISGNFAIKDIGRVFEWGATNVMLEITSQIHEKLKENDYKELGKLSKYL